MPFRFLLLLTPISTFALPAQRWRSLEGLPPRQQTALAYDASAGRTILFGGYDAQGLYSYMPTSAFADTWSYDGASWHEIVPQHFPAARTAHAMTWDAARQRVVLHGGIEFGAAAGAYADDTWEFDGSDWTERSPATVPPGRAYAHMTFDAARQRVVLFGGQGPLRLQDTWEWDGVDWSAGPSGPGITGPLGFVRSIGRAVLVGATPLNAVQTWEYDGSTWTQVQTATVPQYPRAVAEAPNGQLLALALASNAIETWSYDGSTWRVLAPATALPVDFTELAYDTARNVTVLLTSHDTWEFDGVDWALSVPARAVASRSSAAIAFDPIGDRVVSVGGFVNGQGVTDDLREWRETVGWRQVVQTNPPPARVDARLVYDTARDVLVLHGGSAGMQTFVDTWELRGSQWSQVPTVSTPPYPVQAMAYDPIRARCVAYAARIDYPATASTWTFDGSDWEMLPTNQAPPPRLAPELVYDAARNTIVLWGGTLGSPNVLVDTWELRGSSWQNVNPQVRPPAGAGRAVFDPRRGRVVLDHVEAYPGTPSSWDFDGTSWSRLSVRDEPARRLPYAAVADVGRGRLLKLGPWNEVWTFDPPPIATWTRYGIGCGNGIGPWLDASPAASTPAAGTTFGLRATGLPANAAAVVFAFGFDYSSYQGAALPITIGALGYPTCSLWLAPVGIAAFATAAGGSASYGLPIPVMPALAGIQFAVQGIVLDPTRPTGVAGLTNAGIGTIH